MQANFNAMDICINEAVTTADNGSHDSGHTAVMQMKMAWICEW